MIPLHFFFARISHPPDRCYISSCWLISMISAQVCFVLDPIKGHLCQMCSFVLKKKRHSLHTELSNALQVCMFWLPMPLLQNINNSILIHHPCLKGVMEQGGRNLREIILFSALKSLKFHPHSSQDPHAPLCFFYFEPFMSAESARRYPQCSLPPGSSN